MSQDIVVITGANRGIGLELARQTLERGHLVIAGVRTQHLSAELEKLAKNHLDQLKIHDLDVQSDPSVLRFADHLNIDHVDLLINNAGIYLSNDGKSTETPAHHIMETLNTNSLGPIRVTQALAPLLRKSKHPRVANISSLMGSVADCTSGGSVAYRMSKTALNMFTKVLAIDEKSWTVITFHPGWVKTRMGGEQAPVEPKESAAGILRVLEKTSARDSGRFLNYKGDELPW